MPFILNSEGIKAYGYFSQNKNASDLFGQLMHFLFQTVFLNRLRWHTADIIFCFQLSILN